MTSLRHLRHLMLAGFMLLACMVLLSAAQAHAQGRGGARGGMMGMGGGRMGDRGLTPSAGSQTIHRGPMLAPPGRFWDDKKTVKKLDLRPEQQKRMDDLFNSSKDNLLSLYNNLQNEQQRFGSMSREDLQDENKVFAQIDRVAQARADLEKANAHLLLQIRKELDPPQLAELDHEIASSQ
ncbi:periplasmic heavy metal sensor [Granulicella mallensis]|uniref:Spy/CpxP family protein refolding chaperone n=1 Tax=Granulicella mallensis TaxID=940614 RepID=A0A7W7ZSE8_9BACT|nr:periplasmic heavy metal sensor [Granulicella mallensis]MBB5065215.1 Spy/CpxP family protein refolding chaperone [Granulicella mallensis]